MFDVGYDVNPLRPEHRDLKRRFAFTESHLKNVRYKK
jgi:hypothetical protein